MDVVGSEIGQKMRSAIKAKLTELGCYVDDELPDYVMVMVANKRTRAQMEDDLQLFLGDNTELFVNWLHQVLKKLQEVTVTAPLKTVEAEKSKERSKSKEHKSKDKKEKSKKSDLKKAKKKEKEKLHRKKEEKKEKKSKKKSKHHDMIRPNIPPLLMNIEKESEPSITDVFAGQILKSHGITVESLKEEKILKDLDQKVVIKEPKRPILPIIDPATISSQPDPDVISLNTEATADLQEKEQKASVSSQEAAKEEQIKEINEIEAKIQGLKQKLTEQLDSMSEDEDFLNIRTEAEELMNDFAEDVFQEISQQAPVSTPPIEISKSPSPPKQIAQKPAEIPKPIETLPQIELNLPKRPVRERLGAREEPKKVPEVAEWRIEHSPERFTPEPKLDFNTKSKSAKSRLSDLPEKNISISDDSSDKSESSVKRITSKVSVLESRARTCASVVRVRPRPRVSAPASSLLLRAVADAHKSLLTIPPKVDTEPQKIKRGIVLPMRRVGDPNIVIQVPAERTQTDSQDDNLSLEMDSDEEKRVISELERDEYVPKSLTMQIKNTDYVPSRRSEGRSSSRRDETLVIETINIHNPTVDKDKNTQFIVTMDGFNPNAFLAKKLSQEGLLDDEDTEKPKENAHKEKDSTKESVTNIKPQESTNKEKPKDASAKSKESKDKETPEKCEEKHKESPKKRLSSESTESNTQVVIKLENDKSKGISSELTKTAEKRKSDQTSKVDEQSPPVKKRRTPIVFDVDKKEKEVVKERERRESASSDNNVIVTTTTNTHKYDALPPYEGISTKVASQSTFNSSASELSQAERKPWCRAFPLCRYGPACAFQHPRCKFAAACTRRGCVYSHSLQSPTAPTAPMPPTPAISSQVVPAANYKSISASPLPSMCKFYPSCSNPVCAYFHPKACRYGAACLNKMECNFYHAELSSKWRYPA